MAIAYQFFTNRLKHRWEEIKRIEAEAEQKCKLEAYLNSDEYKQKRKQEEESAKADPTSVLHTVNAESITDRVRLDDDPLILSSALVDGSVEDQVIANPPYHRRKPNTHRW